MLQIVGSRLRTDTLSTSEYRIEQESILAEDWKRWLHGRQLLFPTTDQIVTVVGSWEGALRLAGLQPTRKPGPTKRGKPPALVDLMDRFHALYGVEPTAQDLRRFARGNGIAYPATRPNNSYMLARKEWRERRRANGLPEAKVAKRGRDRTNNAPDYSRDVGAALRASATETNGAETIASRGSHATSANSVPASVPRRTATPTGPRRRN